MKTLAISSMLLLAAAFCKCEELATRSVDVELKIADPNGNVVAENKPSVERR